MTLCIQQMKGAYVTIISAYAPTLVSPEETKDNFYASLDTAVRRIPAADIILLGDFNALRGKNSEIWQGVISKHSIGKINSNGLCLLSFCAEHQLCITNTLFQFPDKLIVTWMHSNRKTGICWTMQSSAVATFRTSTSREL